MRLKSKAKDMVVKILWVITKRGENTGTVVIVCYQPVSQQDAGDEG